MSDSRLGRPPASDADSLARVALDLFARTGYDAVTMDDIARAAGVSRRTLFRYFPSKADLVWGGLEEATERLLGALRAIDPRRSALDPGRSTTEPGRSTTDPARSTTEPGHSAAEVLRAAYAEGLRFSPELVEVTRRRLVLIAEHPSLTAFGAPRIAALIDPLAALLNPDDPFAAHVLAAAYSSAGFAALTWWAQHSDEQPFEVVERAFNALERGAAG